MSENFDHNNIDQKKVKPKEPKVRELIQEVKTVILATQNEDGSPAASYSPFVETDGSFQILVSFMAKHTKNLKDRKKVSFMFIEDEATSKQIFARHRLTIESEAVTVEKGTELWNKAIEGMSKKHGKMVNFLQELDDFIMIDLKPIKGSYVNGFGSAYFVDENLNVLEHRKGEHGKHNMDSTK